MLPKINRVNKDLFNLIMKKGSFSSGKYLTFRYINDKNLENKGHFAFVAPKGVAKLSTKRNSLRRKGYNNLKKYSLNGGSGVFFYNKEGLKATNEEIAEDIGVLLKKAKFI